MNWNNDAWSDFPRQLPLYVAPTSLIVPNQVLSSDDPPFVPSANRYWSRAETLAFDSSTASFGFEPLGQQQGPGFTYDSGITNQNFSDHSGRSPINFSSNFEMPIPTPPVVVTSRPSLRQSSTQKPDRNLHDITPYIPPSGPVREHQFHISVDKNDIIWMQFLYSKKGHVAIHTMRCDVNNCPPELLTPKFKSLDAAVSPASFKVVDYLGVSTNG